MAKNIPVRETQVHRLYLCVSRGASQTFSHGSVRPAPPAATGIREREISLASYVQNIGVSAGLMLTSN